MKKLLLAILICTRMCATLEESKEPKLSEDLLESSKIIAATLLSGAAFDFLNNSYGYLSFFTHGYDQNQSIIGQTRALTRVALPASVLIANAARSGSWPKLTAQELVKPALLVNLGVFLSTVSVGAIGYHKGLAKRELLDEISASDYAIMPAFLADLYMRNMCYLSGSLGTLLLISGILRKRYELHKKIVRSRKTS